jgi:hypothetical protein
MINGGYVPTRMTATHQNAAAEPGVFDGVADQFTAHGAKKQGTVHHERTGRDGSDLDTLS